jgi:hypothetical protein
MHSPSSAKTLLIYGSFGVQGAHKAIKHWSQVVVLEVDAFLPPSLREQCAGVVTIPPLLQQDEGDALQQRAEDLLYSFLDDLVSIPSLLTSRRFRAACLSIDAWRIVVPYLVCLEYAKKVVELGPFEKIIVTLGSGVSQKAFIQLAEMLGVPIDVLAMDRQKPPLMWMLKRKFQRFWVLREKKKSKTSGAKLPLVSELHSNWCADARLETAVANDDDLKLWVRAPSFAEPNQSDLLKLQAEYEEWWGLWWQAFLTRNPSSDPMAPFWILQDLGQWACQKIYPRHALLFKQAHVQIGKWSPAKLLIGSMRGRQDFLWGLAAQDHGIPVVVYTVDCHIDARLCFKPDHALCDDTRQWDIAVKTSSELGFQASRVQSHRFPPGRKHLRARTETGRKQILLADSYYSGVIANSSPSLSLWSYEKVIEAAKKLPEYDFLIKFHPVRERPEPRFHHSGLHHLHLWFRDQWIKQMAPPKNVKVLAPEVNLSEMLPEIDLLLNIQSYAGLEAFALHIPVIYLQPWEQEGLYPNMHARGAMQIAVSADRLCELIHLNLNDQKAICSQIDLQSEYLEYFYSRGYPNIAQAALSESRG